MCPCVYCHRTGIISFMSAVCLPELVGLANANGTSSSARDALTRATVSLSSCLDLMLQPLPPSGRWCQHYVVDCRFLPMTQKLILSRKVSFYTQYMFCINMIYETERSSKDNLLWSSSLNCRTAADQQFVGLHHHHHQLHVHKDELQFHS